MTTYPKPNVGDTLFLVDVDNRARDGRGKQRPCTVVKVGRKYFTVEYGEGTHPIKVELRLDTWRENTNYSADYQAYPDIHAWRDEREQRRWLELFRVTFSHFSSASREFSLQQLRDAAKVLELTLPEDDVQ